MDQPLQRCVHDFFIAGGERAAIVRVANGARPCTIRLPAREGVLELEALSPGRKEFLRASVDYDQVAASDDLTFNLVVQRLRAPGTERVADQEIYPRLSLCPTSERYVADMLLESRLVRVRGAAADASRSDDQHRARLSGRLGRRGGRRRGRHRADRL
jgi:uncharacterized protein